MYSPSYFTIAYIVKYEWQKKNLAKGGVKWSPFIYKYIYMYIYIYIGASPNCS